MRLTKKIQTFIRIRHIKGLLQTGSYRTNKITG